IQQVVQGMGNTSLSEPVPLLDDVHSVKLFVRLGQVEDPFNQPNRPHDHTAKTTTSRNGSSSRPQSRGRRRRSGKLGTGSESRAVPLATRQAGPITIVKDGIQSTPARRVGQPAAVLWAVGPAP